MNPRKLCGRIKGHALYIFLGQIHACVGADFGQGVPFVHSKLAHPYVDIEAIVVLGIDVAFGEMVLHLAMRLFAILNLLYQPPSGLCKIAYAARDKALPPEMLLIVGTIRSLARTDANEDSDIAPRPFVTNGFVQSHGSGVVSSCAFVEENRLANLDRLECEGGGSSGASSLPDCGIWLHGSFFTGVVGAQENLACTRLLCAFVDGCNCPVDGQYKMRFVGKVHLRFCALFAIVVQQGMGVPPLHCSYAQVYGRAADLAIVARGAGASVHAPRYGTAGRHRDPKVC